MSETNTTTQSVDEQAKAAATQQTEPEKDQATGKFVYKFESVDAEGQPKEYKFLYSDHKDLADQLVDAKKNGDKFIHEVKSGKRTLTPAQPKPDFKTVEATDEAEKTRRAQVRKDLEAEIGAPLDSVKARLQFADQIREYTVMREWAVEAQAEGYVICSENAAQMLKFLNGDNPEKKVLDKANQTNLRLAFETLKEEDKLILGKSTTETSNSSTVEPNSSASTTGGTTQSSQPASGVRPGQFEGARPAQQSGDSQPLTAKRYREINLMSLSEFKRLERTSKREYDAFVQMQMSKRSQA